MLLMHASILLLGQWYLSFSLFSYPCNRDPSQIFVFVSTWLVNDGLELILVVVQLFSCSVVSDTLQPRTLQHARLPCPSPSPRACSNSRPLSQWCQPNILFSVIPFSLCLQSFPAPGTFLMSALHIRWPKYWSFIFSLNPSNEYSGLIFFTIDWFDRLAIQWTLKSLLQHHSLKASILQHSAFFMVQPSHPYMTTGKTIALTRWTFVDKVLSLLVDKVMYAV